MSFDGIYDSCLLSAQHLFYKQSKNKSARFCFYDRNCDGLRIFRNHLTLCLSEERSENQLFKV